ncbi:MAG: aromatic amino acid aminotransferase [Pseudomonadota bacterium]|jgi:aromatic-amino-acid transaminase
MSLFSNVELAPRDPILGLNEAYNSDTRSNKVNLGVGVYFTDDGKIPLLRAVQAAEKIMMEKSAARGYLAIEGIPAYNQGVQNLLFGQDSEILTAGRVVTAQAVGGTGALKIGADFIKRLEPNAIVAISDPSWENHRGIFESAGFTVQNYTYYDPSTRGVNFEGMVKSLEALPAKSVVLLHACCHNPTGADLSATQWEKVAELCKTKNLIPFLDMAYQGFADSIDEDGAAVRLFAKAGLCFFVSSSFSKSFSLYGERVGALSVVTASKDESTRVMSQLKRVIRTNYSNPAIHGGTVVATVLNSPELRSMWEQELGEMRDRIKLMRNSLVSKLAEAGANRDFGFVNAQRGMFSYSGLSADQVERLKTEFGIYAVSTGRICVAALNSKNIDGVAKAIATVL